MVALHDALSEWHQMCSNKKSGTEVDAWSWKSGIDRNSGLRPVLIDLSEEIKSKDIGFRWDCCRITCQNDLLHVTVPQTAKKPRECDIQTTAYDLQPEIEILFPSCTGTSPSPVKMLSSYDSSP
jgi:hypothetical protein